MPRLLRRILPHPILSALLALVWVLLQNEVSRGGVAMAVLLGLAIPILTAPYWTNRPLLPRPFLFLTYFVVVVWDILRANVTVALAIAFKRPDRMAPAWITIPLELRKPEAITVLAGTITLTPGTLSAEVSADGHALLVHCLDAPDPDAVRDEIKSRYERRLMRIFQ